MVFAGMVKVSCTPSPAWRALRSLTTTGTGGEGGVGSPGAPQPPSRNRAKAQIPKSKLVLGGSLLR
jgi:hypothetical protein